jgi:uncharacterized protein
MNPMQFLADAMLGRLATWLRLLGYDTVYENNATDAELARRARLEQRILLTRDVELTHRRGVRALLIETDQVESQLEQVIRALNLTVQQAFSRCAECNQPLEEATKNSVREQVPPYVFHTQEHFRRCANCGRVYWRGTHWAHMLERLEDIG